MKTLDAFEKAFLTEDDCKDYIVAKRWPNGVHCPRCNNDKVYALKTRPYHWVCKSGAESVDRLTGEAVICSKNGYRFSVISGTIFQDTKIPLKLWFKVGYLMLTAKKGISSLQVHRVVFGEHSGSDWRTAWYLCHRWRAAMRGDAFPLEGVVEIDETFIGGKQGNRHRQTRRKYYGTGITSGKTTVIGAIARKGNVVAKVIENTDRKTLMDFAREATSTKVSLVVTDEHQGYARLGQHFDRHEVIQHKTEEYVRGEVHTQNIESFWSLLKRGIVGTFHNVSASYLPLYLNEFSFRHNNRKEPDMFALMVETCGK